MSFETLEPLKTPLASRLEALVDGPDCHDFHAVPWPGLLRDLPTNLARSYRKLMVAGLAQSDRSWVGGAVDSFFAPHGPLALAQAAAAAAFGADATFFGSGGTTLSNRIALEAVCPEDGALLMDPAAHQSLIFAAEGRPVIKMPTLPNAESPRMDVAATVRLLAKASQRGQPFAAMALTACHYDGRRIRLEHVLPMLIEASPGTAIIVDEAWSAIHGFSSSTAASALAVCKRLPLSAPVVVTQSAHKTMAALRQGSYIHILGDSAARLRLQQAIYRNHSTSPSWPILVSLDLARAHAQHYGASALVRASALFAELMLRIKESPQLRPFLMPLASDAFYEFDPLVLHLRSPGPAAAVQRWLFERYRILLGQSRHRLVIRVHIGVQKENIDALLAALTDMADATVKHETTSALWENPPDAPLAAPLLPEPGRINPEYLIAYPPGVPMVQPGETWTVDHAECLAKAQAQGAEIHQLPPVRRQGSLR